jgi:hypothetical protein
MNTNFFLDGEDLSFGKFSPFSHRRLFFKGGDPDTDIKDTADQKELAKIAIEKFARYKEVFQPVENAYMHEVSNLNSESKQQDAQSMAVANTETAFADVMKDEVQAITGRGTNINSGAINQAINDGSTNKAVARSENVNMTGQALQDQHVKGLQGVVAMGNGQSSEAIQGMGEIANYSADAARDDAVNDYNKTSARNESIGAIGGMAYSAHKNSSKDDVT